MSKPGERPFGTAEASDLEIEAEPQVGFGAPAHLASADEELVARASANAIRQTIRVNGRALGRGRAAGRPGSARWQVRLGLAWDAETDEHAWLSVVCEPPRPGVASGVWLLPLTVLGESLDRDVSVGTVRLTPGEDRRMWLEVTARVGTASRPWTVSVPRRWFQRFLEDVTTARRSAQTGPRPGGDGGNDDDGGDRDDGDDVIVLP